MYKGCLYWKSCSLFSIWFDLFQVLADDGVFKVTMGPASKGDVSQSGGSNDIEVFTPRPRMSAGMAVKHGVLYLYGGLFEQDEVQYTLADFYALGKLVLPY